LLDRIDLYVSLSQESGGLTAAEPAETSAQVASRVHAAWKIQNERQGELNAYLNESLLDQQCQLDFMAKELLIKLVEQHGLSARAVQRTRRVARTCADLAGSESISRAHLSEAYRYRVTSNVQ
jgi:magnesium chelatase family protein